MGHRMFQDALNDYSAPWIP